MSSSISSIGSYASTMAMMGMQKPPRPDSSKLAADLFSQIDSTGKGYIEQSDLEAAFEKVGSTTSTSADELFSSLDSDGDGKVTQSEMTSGLQSLMESLDSQFESMRMSEAMGAMGAMPPPPPGNDTGFTQEELEAQLEEIGDTDSERSALISSVLENFEAADADGDGKVTFQEAMDYQQSSATTAAASETATTSSSGGTGLTEAELMLQVMKLVEAYGLFSLQQESSTLSTVA